MADAHAAHVYRIAAGDWYGSITDGIEITNFAAPKPTTDPETILPNWGNGSLIIAARFGTAPGGSASVSSTTYPTGYVGGTSTFANGTTTNPDTAVETAYKRIIADSESPETFGGTFTGFNEIYTILLAVRGYNGSPPEPSGNFAVQVDDTDSQDDHNAIRTYRSASNLFANSTDATTYANLVLTTHADDRPILSLTFVANKSGAYRQQALSRRISDKITVVANNNAGLGISQDFFIESISHRFSQGTKMWETTWELSPA